MIDIGIYKITSPTGKVYIGQSWDIRRRMNYYKCKRGAPNQQHLNSSFLKHGVDKHRFEIIHSLPIDITQEVMDLYEQLYISQYKLCGLPMMNIREGGQNSKASESTRLKMSAAGKGRVFSEETRGKIRISNTGKKCTDETKEKLRKRFTGFKHSKETKLKMSLTRQGVKMPNMKNGKRKAVLQYDLNRKFVKRWESTAAVEKVYGKINVYAAAMGLNKHAGNFLWDYENRAMPAPNRMREFLQAV